MNCRIPRNAIADTAHLKLLIGDSDSDFTGTSMATVKNTWVSGAVSNCGIGRCGRYSFKEISCNFTYIFMEGEFIWRHQFIFSVFENKNCRNALISSPYLSLRLYECKTQEQRNGLLWNLIVEIRVYLMLQFQNRCTYFFDIIACRNLSNHIDLSNHRRNISGTLHGNKT